MALLVVLDILKSTPDALRSKAGFLFVGEPITFVAFKMGLAVLEVTLLAVSSFGGSSWNSNGPSP